MEDVYDKVVGYASRARSHAFGSMKDVLETLTPEFEEDSRELDIDTLEELKQAEIRGDIQTPESNGRYDYPSVEELRNRRERVENALGLENEGYLTLEN